MATVAKVAGVSKNRVSLALQGSPRVAEDTRGRILMIATELGYTLNPTVAELMAELRRNRTPGYQATLAIINAPRDRDAFRPHPTIPNYVRGCMERTKHLGYGLDEFWLHDPVLTVPRWLSMLRARNIRGLLVVGMMHQNCLPERLERLWQEFPAVTTGVRTRQPGLSFACSDHHGLALEAFEKAVELGYRRPALVLDRVIDDLTEGRFTAGFLTAQSRLVAACDRTAPFYQVVAARGKPRLFADWLEEHRPDVIFTLYHEVRRWLQGLGRQVPEDIGLIQYEWRPDHRDWAGMDQRNDLVGQAAVDMLGSMIHHRERGVPVNPRATMIGSSWVNGGTAGVSRQA